MGEPLTIERKEYWLGFVEGYAQGRRGLDARERVSEGQDWKQGRIDGREAGLRDRKERVRLEHSLHVKRCGPEEWEADTCNP